MTWVIIPEGVDCPSVAIVMKQAVGVTPYNMQQNTWRIIPDGVDCIENPSSWLVVIDVAPFSLM